MTLANYVFAVLLFFVLVPGVLVTLPKNSGKYKVAAVHALIFGIVFYFTNKFVLSAFESFKEGAAKKKKASAPKASSTVACKSDPIPKVRNSGGGSCCKPNGNGAKGIWTDTTGKANYACQ